MDTFRDLLFSSNKKRYIAISVVFFITALITMFYSRTLPNSYDVLFKNFYLNHSDNASTQSTVRICCLILTTPKNFLTRTKAINDTWAPHCDRYFFITEILSQSNLSPELIRFTQNIPIAPINTIIPGYDHLTQKSTLAFLFAYENHFKDFDWFVKADDDTFLILENLRILLSKQNSSEPITFGYNFKVLVKDGYHSGGASYVLSRESLRRFHQAHQDPSFDCRKDGGSEDVEIAKCLRKNGVYLGKSVDKQNRELFHPLPFSDHFFGTFPDWLGQYAENPLRAGYDCCSDETISFHYVSPQDQYLLNFLLYKIRRICNGTNTNENVTTSKIVNK